MESLSPTPQKQWSLGREIAPGEIKKCLRKFGTMIAIDNSTKKYYRILELKYQEDDELRSHTRDGLAIILTRIVTPPPPGFAGIFEVLKVDTPEQ